MLYTINVVKELQKTKQRGKQKMTNYEKLQQEVLKTRELLAQAVMVMDEDNYYMFKTSKLW